MAWPDLYKIDQRFDKYNGLSAWQTLRSHFCRETIVKVRDGVSKGYVSLELLSFPKRIVLALFGIGLKSIVKQICFRIAYHFGVMSLFYWLNRNAKRTLVFHNILPDDMAMLRLPNDGSALLSDLTLVIKELRKRFTFSLDVFDSKSITLTFDDGYRNQYSVAYKYLSKEGIPAFLFASGDAISGKILNIDKIMMWFAKVPQEYIPGGDRKAFWNNEIWPRYCMDGINNGANVIKWLNRIYLFEKVWDSLSPSYYKERLGGISIMELKEMRESGWVIGWHTQTHPPLCALTDDAVKKELSAPDDMKKLPISYPYGSEKLVGKRERELAERMGFPYAFANTHESEKNSSLYFLARMHIWNFDKYDIHYEMSGLRFFVQHHRLMPVIRRSNAV